jgi:hypothetical protein
MWFLSKLPSSNDDDDDDDDDDDLTQVITRRTTPDQREAYMTKIVSAHIGSVELDDDRDATKKLFQPTPPEFKKKPKNQTHISFIVLTLFRLFFDNEAWRSTAMGVLNANQRVVKLLEPSFDTILTKLDAEEPYKEALGWLPTISPGVDSDADADADADDGDRDGIIDWTILRGTKTVRMDMIEEFYSKDAIRHMTELGLTSEYGEVKVRSTTGKHNYAEVIWPYVYSENDNENDAVIECMRRINILTDHPPAVKNIVNIAMKDYDAKKMRRLLRSHLIWHYFDARTSDGLAIDWLEKKSVGARLGQSATVRKAQRKCLATITSIKSLLLFYFNLIIDLCNAGEVPAVIGSSLFRFPVDLTSAVHRYIEVDSGDSERKKNADEFDKLNASFLGDVLAPITFINNRHFRDYCTSNKIPFFDRKSDNNTNSNSTKEVPPLESHIKSLKPVVVTQYPILRLHSLFEVYNKFLEIYRNFLAQQLDTIEANIINIDRIITRIVNEGGVDDAAGDVQRPPHPSYDQRLAYTGQPINSGIIKLRAVVVLFMNRAFNNIRIYCPHLHDIQQEDLQSKSAFDCGLESDYACYVAALIAENGISFSNGYKSKAAQHHIAMNSGNAIQRLKKYGCRRVGRRLEFYLVDPNERRNKWTGGHYGSSYISLS